MFDKRIYLYCFTPPTMILISLKFTNSIRKTGFVFCFLMYILFTYMMLKYGGSLSVASSSAFLTQIFVFFLGTPGLMFVLIASTIIMYIQTEIELNGLFISDMFQINLHSIYLIRSSFIHYICWFCFFAWLIDLAHRQLRNSLEIANRHKSEFVAKMSHELRTPLFGIVGCLEILEQRVTEERDSLEMAKTCSNNLLQLIDDVLDIAKIEAGHIKLEIKSIYMDEIVGESIQVVSNQASKKRINLTKKVLATPRTFRGDPARLRQVIINLLMNAIKFTPEEGSVELSVSYVKQFSMPYALNVYSPHSGHGDFSMNSNGFIQFSVCDNGIGLNMSEMKRIFNAFEQADVSIPNRYGGCGLGLDISNQLISQMGGILIVYSDGNGKGSTFQFIIPYVNVEEGDVNIDKKRIRIKRARGKRQFKPFVLIVEDNEINQKILKKMLEDLGCKCDVASNGQEALELIKKKKYELIFMDLEMPILDGISCTTKVREAKITTPIVGLSAHTKQEHKLISAKAGMNDFITKPVLKSTLEEILDTWTSKKK